MEKGDAGIFGARTTGKIRIGDAPAVSGGFGQALRPGVSAGKSGRTIRERCLVSRAGALKPREIRLLLLGRGP